MSQLTLPPELPSGTAAASRLRMAASWTLDAVQGVSLRRLLVLTVRLALVLAAFYMFRVEESHGFYKLLPLIFVGFLVHAALPRAARLPFFLALSGVAFCVVLGVVHGLVLIGLGLGLIGLCHLPLPYPARVSLVLLAGAGLVGLQTQFFDASFSTTTTDTVTLVLPVLGSMFMFRLMVYLYEIRNERRPATIWQRLGYFFLFPNVCFLLFPLIDFKTFQRTYYDRPAIDIYEKGVLWMTRGLLQLLLYRLVYLYLVPAPGAIESLGGVVLFVVTSYLIYLRVSGTFHLIIGLLCLFGFNLPETHRLYFMATGFNDFWRRANIYWKDFMVKLFYYPAFIRVKRFGMQTRLTLATVYVFVATWLLHSYQWFWIRGEFPLRGTDATFWGVLGGLVIVNTLYEARRPKAKRAAAGWSLGVAVRRGLQMVGMFLFMCFLWSIWNSASMGAWVNVMMQARHASILGWLGVAAGGIGMLALAVGAQYVLYRWPSGTNDPSFRGAPGLLTAVMAVLLVVAQPEVRTQLSGPAMDLATGVFEGGLSQQDQMVREAAYYEALIDADAYTAQLWDTEPRTPRDWIPIRKTDAAEYTGDMLRFTLKPSAQVLFKRQPFTTNQWGFRDQEYALEKPPGTYRAVVLGSSYVMGTGVSDGEAFEQLVEDRLNEDPPGGRFERFELLNFAVGNYRPPQQIEILTRKALAFDPDAVFYIAHQNEADRTVLELATVVEELKQLPTYPYLVDIVEKAGLTPDMPLGRVRKLLEPYADEILRRAYRHAVEEMRLRGVMPVWVYIPVTTEGTAAQQESIAAIEPVAREAGFLTYALPGVYAGYATQEVQVAPWDSHANVLGHSLIADRFYEMLRAHDDVLQLGFSGVPVP